MGDDAKQENQRSGTGGRATPVKVFLWATFCLVWTYAFPGYIAYDQDVFTAPQVQAKVQNLYPGCRNDSSGVMVVAGRSACNQTIPVARFFAENRHAKERPDIAFFGFVESRTCYCYFLATFALGILVVRQYAGRFGKKGERVKTLLSVLKGVPLMALIGVVWEGLNVARAYSNANAARTIFSFVHRDVNPFGFGLQLARSAGLCLLVAIVWQNAEKDPARDSAEDPPPTFDAKGLNQAADELGSRVEQRQIDSLLLGLAFFPWTLYYWSLNARWGDPRYLMSTLIWHLVWGITLWFVSASTFRAWYQFGRRLSLVRAALLERVHDTVPPKAGEVPPKTYDAELHWLENLKPISTVRMALTSAAAIVAFFLPLVKAFR